MTAIENQKKTPRWIFLTEGITGFAIAILIIDNFGLDNFWSLLAAPFAFISYLGFCVWWDYKSLTKN